MNGTITLDANTTVNCGGIYTLYGTDDVTLTGSGTISNSSELINNGTLTLSDHVVVNSFANHVLVAASGTSTPAMLHMTDYSVLYGSGDGIGCTWNGNENGTILLDGHAQMISNTDYYGPAWITGATENLTVSGSASLSIAGVAYDGSGGDNTNTSNITVSDHGRINYGTNGADVNWIGDANDNLTMNLSDSGVVTFGNITAIGIFAGDTASGGVATVNMSGSSQMLGATHIYLGIGEARMTANIGGSATPRPPPARW